MMDVVVAYVAVMWAVGMIPAAAIAADVHRGRSPVWALWLLLWAAAPLLPVLVPLILERDKLSRKRKSLFRH